MGNYSRDNNRRGGGFDRGNRSGGGRDGGRPDMHRATCSDCGDSCEVPFKPTGSKPIFCSDCFGKQDGGGRDRGGSNRFGGDRRDDRRDSSRGDRQMHDAVCNKCGKNCQVPFRPTAGKDIFCSGCFEQNGGNKGRKDGQPSEELKEINTKLDMIMTALGLSGPKKEKKSKKEPYISKADRKVTEKKEVKKEATKKTVAKKPAKKKVVAKKKAVAKKVAKKATKKTTKAKPKAKAKKVVKKKAVAKKKK
jgi:CxxC-x17-CxxC domain-containing protein